LGQKDRKERESIFDGVPGEVSKGYTGLPVQVVSCGKVSLGYSDK